MVTLLEEIGLPTSNGVMSRITTPELLTLLLIILVEHTDLLAFSCLINWLTLLTLQILGLVALLKQTGLLTFKGLTS